MKMYKTVFLAGAILISITAWSPINKNANTSSGPDISELGTRSTTAGLVSIRTLNLKKDVDKNAFEQFVVNEYVPTLRTHIPGASALVVKGDRGENQGEYLFLYLWDSSEIRDLYFPETGEPTEVWQAIDAASEGAIQKMFDKMATYLEGETFGEFTDYAAVR